MRRLHSPTSHLIHALVLVCLLPAGSTLVAASSEPGPYRVLAGPYSKKQVKAGVGHGVAQVTLKGLIISVEFLGPEERVAFVKSLDASMADPFAARPGHPQGYSTFRVTFENHSPADVLFQAGNVLMMTDQQSHGFPIDLTDLYRAAEQAGVAAPEQAFERFARVMFDSSTTIPLGKSLGRLLVFRPLPVKWKELQLHFSYLQIGSETHTVSFSFHKQPLSE